MAGAGETCGFQCPSNFVPVAECRGSVKSDTDTEVWLIKAPSDFTPESFSSHRLPLSGYKMQKMKVNSVKKYYHVMSSHCSDSPFRALLCSPEPSAGSLVCAPPFQGIITLAEAHGDHTALNSIPDRPPLLIPQGLKQRYRPFGATAPRAVPDNVGQSQWSGSTKKKKKAKKRKQEGLLLMDL
ncbi:DNA-directed RNA polymerase I subunit RPA34-like isoform X2 [Pseudophryne corroboree]|uniref:DNA-directed RNA polymerase I subunit RPA34-like isoform X2 n=1 Tax=Pseudophryne corroboree TaxID=495146 RepID=UPI003081737F